MDLGTLSTKFQAEIETWRGSGTPVDSGVVPDSSVVPDPSTGSIVGLSDSSRASVEAMTDTLEECQSEEDSVVTNSGPVVQAVTVKGRLSEPALHRFVLRRRRCVQDPPKLLFLVRGQRRSARRLGLKQSAEEDPIVGLGTDQAQIPSVGLAGDLLGLKDLGFAFTAALAEHGDVLSSSLWPLNQKCWGGR